MASSRGGEKFHHLHLMICLVNRVFFGALAPSERVLSVRGIRTDGCTNIENEVTRPGLSVRSSSASFEDRCCCRVVGSPLFRRTRADGCRARSSRSSEPVDRRARSARAHGPRVPPWRSECSVGARQETSYLGPPLGDLTYPERGSSTLTSPIQGLYRPKTGVRLAVAVPTTSVGFVRAERWIEFVSAVWSLGRSDPVRRRFSKSYARVSALGRALGSVV